MTHALKDQKTLYKMTPQQAQSELLAMKSDPVMLSAYLDRYGPHGAIHDQVVEAVTVLFDRAYSAIPGEADKFHPVLDEQFDPETGKEDTVATRAKYESIIAAKQQREIEHTLDLDQPGWRSKVPGAEKPKARGVLGTFEKRPTADADAPAEAE